MKVDADTIICRQAEKITALLTERDGYVKAHRETFEAQTKLITALTAEVERLKTVPMKYRRMEFNAQLQNENVALRSRCEGYRVALETIEVCLDLTNPKGKGYSIADLHRIAKQALADGADGAGKEGVCTEQ